MINSFFVIPGYTFFYWGFTLPKREYPSYIKHFRLQSNPQTKPITLIIKGKRYPAKIRLARITTERFPNRSVVQIFYEREPETLKALRKLLIYSYASTIDKTKPLLKELIELSPSGKDTFAVKVISRQKTDFDGMFGMMEDKNLFDYWRSMKDGKPDTFFIDCSRTWLTARQFEEFSDRVNVIYILYHSRQRQLYVGKANRLGDRVQAGKGRIGLAADWDKGMFFEVHPRYAPLLEQIETFAIRLCAAILPNDVRIRAIGDSSLCLVNRQLRPLGPSRSRASDRALEQTISRTLHALAGRSGIRMKTKHRLVGHA